MLVDTTLSKSFTSAGLEAARLETDGDDGIWTGETRHDPFMTMVQAAQSTERATIGTSVAIAFARTPLLTAHSAYDLAEIAFSASTPTYRPVLELHGWGDLQPELTRLTKAGRGLHARWGSVSSRISLYATYEADPAIWPVEEHIMSTPRVALVTGAARGIGAAIADALAADGWTVAIADLDPAAATATAASIATARGIGAAGFSVDIADLASSRLLVTEVESQLGPVAALVNNAGIDIIKPFVESTEDEWDRIIAVNLKGTIGCCRAVLDGMIERGDGAIVSIASDAGRVGSSGEAVYSATKGGVISFSKTLAREVARSGIRVNCVCPGPTETALLGQVAAYSEKLYAGLARAIPLGRTAQPSDVAPAVAFLVSDGARYITGQTLSVSGGLTMA